MVRLAFIVAYLAAMTVAVILLDANNGAVAFGLVTWGVASIALGLGTSHLAWSLLAFLAIPLAAPFGYPNDYQYSEPPPTWWGVAICAFFSAGLIFLAALVGPIVEKLRKPRP